MQSAPAHSPTRTRSDHPSLAYPSPDQSPESSRSAFTSVFQPASPFALAASSPPHLSASHLDLSFHQPVLDPPRFSSFSSASSLASGATSDSDNPFLYQPPALPIPPPRPDRPSYGAGTLPAALPSPLMRSPAVLFAEAEHYVGYEHPLRANPSSVPTSEYAFPPVPMRAPSPPPDESDQDDLERKRRSQSGSSDGYGSAADSDQ